MAEKKIVVHIAQSAGGVAQYLYMLLKNMNKSEYKNILICSNDYRKEIKRFEPFVSEIYFIDMFRNISLKNDIKNIFEIRKTIKKLKPDTVYMHSSKAGALGRIAMIFDFKINKIYNAHGWYFNAQIGKKKQKLYALIEKVLALKTDIIVNISKSEYQSAINNRIAPKRKMCIINNGIDITEFDNVEKYRNTIRTKYNIKEDEKLIGVVGRISEQKDPITFIKSAKLLNEKYTNLKFMYVGSGDLKKEVIQYARINNLEDKIIITGWVNDAKKYISALDIAVLPSKWEGFGLAIIEYMACRKPIVATKVGGIADIIVNEENGLLVEKENERALAHAIEKTIDNCLIKEITDKNYEYCNEKYNIRNVVEMHKKIL